MSNQKVGFCKDCKSMYDSKWCGFICERVSCYHFEVPETEKAQATCATEGIGGELVISHDFGCVLFEAKHLEEETTETINPILAKAVYKYGVENQVKKAIEEMAELIKELIKNSFGEANEASVIEEIADVKIMIEQLEFMFDVQDGYGSINEMMEKKIKRLEQRMKQ